ncbi:MAG: DNA replication/repair protein RecF [Sulfobacillus thermosulfidooxidans]|uniref:DNA replication and repair protein RecF n=1 Tax=Sulfobacillus thermosulfidooxidans TaxID=28034 RepID=A0A2T2X0D7_SULTH|nr:MAG: DNA replication/repair protein RecF [Sulfobacillus thermosulfidooxidans]
MRLDRITIVKFRNIAQASIEFSPQLTLLVGDNGQGKTNTLEAVHVLLTGTSFRSSKDQELIMSACGKSPQTSPEGSNWGVDIMSLDGVVHQDPDRILTLHHRMQLNPLRKKHEGPVLPVVVFSPDDVQLSKGSPQGRRRFLDWLIAPIDSRYLRLFRQYHRALVQRNKALKDPRMTSTVTSFNPLLAQSGSYLWNRRLQILRNISPVAQKIFADLTGLRLEIQLAPGGTHNTMTDPGNYEEMLRIHQKNDQQRGMTLIGPHRDDLILTIDGFPAIDYASQGQHRAIALSLKLASFEILEQETGMTPMVLLDDVLSELDPIKRSRLLKFIALSRPQTVITDTEARNYENLEPVIYHVDQGILRQQEIR